jgi:hypothetical protein
VWGRGLCGTCDRDAGALVLSLPWGHRARNMARPEPCISHVANRDRVAARTRPRATATAPWRASSTRAAATGASSLVAMTFKCPTPTKHSPSSLATPVTPTRTAVHNDLVVLDQRHDRPTSMCRSNEKSRSS